MDEVLTGVPGGDWCGADPFEASFRQRPGSGDANFGAASVVECPLRRRLRCTHAQTPNIGVGTKVKISTSRPASASRK